MLLFWYFNMIMQLVFGNNLCMMNSIISYIAREAKVFCNLTSKYLVTYTIWIIIPFLFESVQVLVLQEKKKGFRSSECKIIVEKYKTNSCFNNFWCFKYSFWGSQKFEKPVNISIMLWYNVTYATVEYSKSCISHNHNIIINRKFGNKLVLCISIEVRHKNRILGSQNGPLIQI